MEAEEDTQLTSNPEGTEANSDIEMEEDKTTHPPPADTKESDSDLPEDGVIVEESEGVEDTSQEMEEEGEISDSKMDDKGGGGEGARVDVDEDEEKIEDEDNEQELDPEQTQEIGIVGGEGDLLKDDGTDLEGKEDEPDDLEIEDREEETIEDSSVDGHPHESVSSGGSIVTRKRTLSHSSGEDGPKRKVGRSVSGAGGGGNQSLDGSKHDRFCWVCHKEGVQVNCKLCPRSYHTKCMSMDYPNAKIEQGDSTCPCPECVVVMNAETIEFRSDSMKQLTVDQLMGLLKNVCLRMKQTPGADPFVKPVDPNDAEDYFDYIVYAMDIETLEKNIKKRMYGSTEGFLADAQWLVHNSIVFNSPSSSYTLHAKRLLKICKQELTEIETCPECYLNAHEKPDSWFVEACRRPHLLVWAKLKGFPFWPAKAMKIKDNAVDVRFFGQHDRAWVSMNDCYMYSEEMPVNPPKKNGALLSALEELTAHVEKLKEVHGPVTFAPGETSVGTQISVEQIRRMLPEYNPPEQGATAAKTQSTTTTTTSSNVKTNAGANNNNNNNKVPPPPKKSPMTIRISSLKTNPTIVNNSAVSAEDNASASSEGRVVTRLTRKSSAAAQQNQSAGLSESDHSTDENQTMDVNSTEEKNAESVPDDNTNGTDEETVQTVPKGSEILANALALGGPLRRSTRGQSRSGDGSIHALEPLSGLTGDKRLTRSTVKGGSIPDTGNETDESSGQVTEDQPPDSVLEAMGLSKKTKEGPLGTQKPITIKGEPVDNDTEGELNIDITVKPSNKNSQSLVEQLSAHSTTVKPGYRFNLSKDISISAVEGGSAEHVDDYEGAGVAMGTNLRVKRPVPPMGQQRSVPQAIPMTMGGAMRPRVQQPNSSILNGQQLQRTFTGQQLRQMVRNARPQHILNPRTGQTVRIAGVPSANRPVSMITVRGQQQQHNVMQKASPKDASAAVDSSLVNSVQGPITLPGGTITVTPLSLMNAGVPITSFDGTNVAQSGQHVALALKTNPSTSTNLGIINVQQQSSGGTTIVNSTGGGAKSTKAGISSVQQRRNLMASIPPSVSIHLQNLTKTMGDLVKTTVEQITLEVIEFCNNTQGKAEASRLQVEVERLQNKLKQEVTDVKHNNDIALRELRSTMENERKRAIAEVKRQMDVDKQKAVEETKKKQWCASCGREALFYCCWNTSYCGYPCQEEHWPAHMSSCSQSSTNPR